MKHADGLIAIFMNQHISSTVEIVEKRKTQTVFTGATLALINTTTIALRSLSA